MKRRVCSIERSTGIVDFRASMKPPAATSTRAAIAATANVPITEAYCSAIPGARPPRGDVARA